VTHTENRSPYILVAADNSTEARAAAEVAIQVAQKWRPLHFTEAASGRFSAPVRLFWTGAPEVFAS
jgi:nucleotide-binding universal stress UspA family protein